MEVRAKLRALHASEVRLLITSIFLDTGARGRDGGQIVRLLEAFVELKRKRPTADPGRCCCSAPKRASCRPGGSGIPD